MKKATGATQTQAGFTLVEALIAIVILAVGLVAISNLFLVAASSNQIGNLTTATAAEASETLERLKAIDFLTTLSAGGASQGSLIADVGAANTTPSLTPDIFVGGALTYHMYRTVPGLGVIRTRWTIQLNSSSPTLTAFIVVESQANSRLGSTLSLSQFSTWRSCTAPGCP